MAGGYTNLDKVRPGGYRRFTEETLPPTVVHTEQYTEFESDEEEEAPPSYQRGGGPLFYPGPPSASRVRSPPPPISALSSPSKANEHVRKNPGKAPNTVLHFLSWV
jgi:hypothetical protein